MEPSFYEKLLGSLSNEEATGTRTAKGNRLKPRPNVDLFTRQTRLRELIKFMKSSTSGSVKVAR